MNLDDLARARRNAESTEWGKAEKARILAEAAPWLEHGEEHHPEVDDEEEAGDAEEGAGAVLLDPYGAASLPPAPGRGVRLLTSNSHYWVREHRTHTKIELADLPGPRVMMVVRGGLTVGKLTLGQGGTAVIPACALSSSVAARRPSTILEVGLASRP